MTGNCRRAGRTGSGGGGGLTGREIELGSAFARWYTYRILWARPTEVDARGLGAVPAVASQTISGMSLDPRSASTHRPAVPRTPDRPAPEFPGRFAARTRGTLSVWPGRRTASRPLRYTRRRDPLRALLPTGWMVVSVGVTMYTSIIRKGQARNKSRAPTACCHEGGHCC